MSPVIELPAKHEEVVLLDETHRPIGSAPKSRIHHADTPLHLAFSLFLFNQHGEMLIQQRAWSKITWPGIWSNACCGHPAPGENPEAAVRRRAHEELGLTLGAIECALPDFRYMASFQGIRENEVCPVWIGLCNAASINWNPTEVAQIAWVDWHEFAAASAHPAGTNFAQFSPWSLLEGRELAEGDVLAAAFQRWAVRPLPTFA